MKTISRFSFLAASFNSGHFWLRHFRIASSSRWLARVTGFCGVHPIALRRRLTWAGWYEIPNSRSITLPIRAHVHNSPRKPYASAPCHRNSGIRSSWSFFNLLGAPGRSLSHNDPTPCRSAALHHLQTADLVTPKASAIAPSLQCSSRSLTARSRRASFQVGVLETQLFMQKIHSNPSTNQGRG